MADADSAAALLQAIHETALGMARHVGMLVEMSNGVDPVRRMIDPLHQDPPARTAESPAAAAAFIALHRSLLERNNSLCHLLAESKAFRQASDGQSVNVGCAGFFGSSWHDVAFLMFQEMAKLFERSIATGKWPGPLPNAVRHRFQPFEWTQLSVRIRDEYDRACSAIRLQQQKPVTPAEPTRGQKKKLRKKRVASREAESRDKWIYQQCMNLVPYDTIAIRLRKKPKSWERIASKQGIRAAAVRYAERHNLDEIPVRQDSE